MAKLQLSPPWITYYDEMREFFSADPEVTVFYDEDEDKREVKLYVSNPSKADALDQLLPDVLDFGGATLEINVVYPNNCVKKQCMMSSYADLFKTALEGNRNVSSIVTVGDVFSNPITYVVFTKEVVQYWNDNLGDINGLVSTLWQNIADNIFTEHDGVYFCTSKDITFSIRF